MNSDSKRFMEDHQALQCLAIEYANAIDAREWDRLDRVFTADALIDYSAMGGIAGNYPDIKKWLPASLRYFAGFTHFMGNFQFDIRGDVASGRVACINPMVIKGLIPGMERTVVFGFWYEDAYRRTEDGWRIVSRTERKCYSLNEPLWMKLGKRIYQRIGARTQGGSPGNAD